jgi:predicted amidohydrolase YtcJ
MKTILTNCTVIDCTGQPLLENTTVVVEGEKIAELQPGIYRQAARAGERVFDLEGGYVLPGLWSAHAHPGDLFPDTKRLMYSESAIDSKASRKR